MRRNMMKAAGGVEVLPLMAWPGDFTGSLVNSGPSILSLDLTADAGISETPGGDTNPSILFQSGASGRSAKVNDTGLDTALNGSDYLEINAIISKGNVSSIIQTMFAKWTYQTNGQFGVEFESNTLIRTYIATSLTDPGIAWVQYLFPAFILNQEYTIKFVYDGSLVGTDRVKIYIDGLLGSVSSSGAIPATLTAGCTAPFKLGNFGGALNRPFLGTLQYVTVSTERP